MKSKTIVRIQRELSTAKWYVKLYRWLTFNISLLKLLYGKTSK